MALGLTPQQIIEKDTHPLLRININWLRVNVEDIAIVQNGYAFSSKYFNHSEGLPLIRIRDINREKTENLFSGEFKEEFIVKRDDVLIGMDGDFNISKWPGKEGLLNQRVCRLIFNSLLYEKEFLYLSLQPYLNAIHEETSAVTVKHLSSKTIKEIPLPLPPLPEQRAIVQKIEQLFTNLDKGIENLKTAQKQLKVYRQAVLKKAFEGELTKEWRAKQKNLPTADELLEQIKDERNIWLENQIINGNTEAKRIKVKLNKLKSNYSKTDLPDNWIWTSFIQACIFVIDCHNKTAPYEDKGIYLIRTSNIRNGKLDLNNKIKYVSEETYKFWSKRVFPKSGDIIFTREAPMGEAAIIPENKVVCLGQRTMILRTPEKYLSNKYLLFNILSEVFKQRFKKDAIGTGVKHLRVGDVESLLFPICSIQEQHQIVQEIESRLSVTDKIEESIKESLLQAEALRQSILKKAFEGELLTDAELEACRLEDDWESAEVLLERIREDRE